MIELIVLFIIVNIAAHELAHFALFKVFGVYARFGIFSDKVFGLKVPIGFEVVPIRYDHSIKQHLLVSIVGFVASVIVSALFVPLMPSVTEKLILIAFPVLLSLGDFKTILILIRKPWNKSVTQAVKINQKTAKKRKKVKKK